jgi:hypothetical protein
MTCSALGAGCAADIWSCGACGAILAASEIGRILSVLSVVACHYELPWPATGRVQNEPLRCQSTRIGRVEEDLEPDVACVLLCWPRDEQARAIDSSSHLAE